MGFWVSFLFPTLLVHYHYSFSLEYCLCYEEFLCFSLGLHLLCNEAFGVSIFNIIYVVSVAFIDFSSLTIFLFFFGRISAISWSFSLVYFVEFNVLTTWFKALLLLFLPSFFFLNSKFKYWVFSFFLLLIRLLLLGKKTMVYKIFLEIFMR